MSEVVPFRRRVEDRFGACPVCARRSGMKNVGRAHWLYCERHGTKWFAGYSRWSGWTRETPGDWLRNASFLSGLREVEPLPWRWVPSGPGSNGLDPDDLEPVLGQ